MPTTRFGFPARFALQAAATASLGLLLANCSTAPNGQRSASREVGAFPESKYGKASQRVVAVGETAPKGGGQRLVGKSYSVAGRQYTPRETPIFTQVGLASYYGEAFHGRKTANGEVYDMSSISAAHPTMPLPSYARVTNVRNGRSLVVRVNDRGPFHANRVMDVSERVASTLDFKRYGTAQIKIDYLGPASTSGSDDRKLLATLRTNDGGGPSGPGVSGPVSPILVASARDTTPAPRAAPVQVASLGGAPNEAAEAEPAAAPQAVMAQPALLGGAAPMPSAKHFVVATNVPSPPERSIDVGVSQPARLVPPTRVLTTSQPVTTASIAPRASNPVTVASANFNTGTAGRLGSSVSSAPLPSSAFAYQGGGSPMHSTVGGIIGGGALYYAASADVVSHFSKRAAKPLALVNTRSTVPLPAILAD